MASAPIEGIFRLLIPFHAIDKFSVRATNQNKVCRARLLTFGLSCKVQDLILDGKIRGVPFPPPLGILRRLSVNSTVLWGVAWVV